MTDSTSPHRHWSAVAEAWDATRRRRRRAFGRTQPSALLERLAVQPGDRVLELAAGPGSLGATLVAARRTDRDGRRSATSRPGWSRPPVAGAPALDNVEAAVIDASAIDRPDESFDVVACRMGLMFTPDPSVALAEIRRVLAPGGRLRRADVGRHRAQPVDDVRRHGGDGERPRRAADRPSARAASSRSAIPASSSAGKGAGFVDVTVEEFRPSLPRRDHRRPRRTGHLAGRTAGGRVAAATPDQLAAVRQTATGLAADHISDQE